MPDSRRYLAFYFSCSDTLATRRIGETNMSDYAIEMRQIVKRFSGMVANDHVDFRVRKGEIHALLGENGAGKSTLMSILFGLYRQDEGEILLNGKPVKISGPREASALGIGMVHQHFKLVKEFTVLENITLGVETTRHGFLRPESAREAILDLSRRYNLAIDIDAKVAQISVGAQQRVEILKMLYRNNDILIFDEPTAVLTPQEIGELIKIIKALAAEDKSIVFITHKLNEIMALCDRCTVLRKGRCVGTVSVADATKEELAQMMVNRKIEPVINTVSPITGGLCLELKQVSLLRPDGKTLLNNISFQLHKGEILCIAGIEGNGQNEIVDVITGMRKQTSGSVLLNGVDLTNKSIAFRNRNGISYIPEDRHKHGLILDFSLQDNLLLKRLNDKPFQRRRFIRKDACKAYAETLLQKYDVRVASGGDTVVRTMSGGNQQKAILAREIELNQDVLIAVQPTRGVDIGAIEFIHKTLLEQKQAGRSILLVSFDLDEVFRISDRILVVYEGECVGEFLPGELSAQEIGLYLSGALRKH